MTPRKKTRGERQSVKKDIFRNAHNFKINKYKTGSKETRWEGIRLLIKVQHSKLMILVHFSFVLAVPSV